jgi:hypothetical protein
MTPIPPVLPGVDAHHGGPGNMGRSEKRQEACKDGPAAYPEQAPF